MNCANEIEVTNCRFEPQK